MIGNAAKVSRFAVTLAVGGSELWTRASAALTSSSVWNMSTFQEKKRSTSAEPRLVTDQTRSRPGTLFRISSMGRVTVTSIWSMGATPLSTPTTIRGKFGFREHRNGDGERQEDPDRDQREDHEDDRLRVPRGPVFRVSGDHSIQGCPCGAGVHACAGRPRPANAAPGGPAQFWGTAPQ